MILLYDSEGRFLLQHRTADAEVMPDYWAFFGGGIGPGESPESAVRRETFEELDYELTAPRFVAEMDFSVDHLKGRLYIFTEAFSGDKSVLRLNEGQDWGWFNEDETGALKMIDHDRQVVRMVADFVRNNPVCGRPV